MDRNSPRHPEPSVFKLLLWTFLWLLMWFWAIAGPLFVILAALSFFVDLPPFVSLTGPDGEPVRTPRQKAIFLALSALISVVGIGFLWLRRRGYLKDPL